MGAETRVRCRPIAEADLPALADLLAQGFPARPRSYWVRGLDRLAARVAPEGYPRFGYMLEREGGPVGVLLVIAAAVTHDGVAHVRCNLASWYVQPAFRSHAAMLGMVPFRLKGATLLNISAAPNTWPTIEAQGFVRYSFGQRLCLPLLGDGGGGLSVERFDPAAPATLPEHALLADHAAIGCLVLLGVAAGERVPFVFLPLRARQGRLGLPGVQLVFCRALDDLARFARPLGWALARRGRPFVLCDATPEANLPPGRFLPGRGRKYVRGPHPPRLGDLAYTEFTIFGP